MKTVSQDLPCRPESDWTRPAGLPHPLARQGSPAEQLSELAASGAQSEGTSIALQGRPRAHGAYTEDSLHFWGAVSGTLHGNPGM